MTSPRFSQATLLIRNKVKNCDETVIPPKFTYHVAEKTQSEQIDASDLQQRDHDRPKSFFSEYDNQSDAVRPPGGSSSCSTTTIRVTSPCWYAFRNFG
jgi:hypothetical protein